MADEFKVTEQISGRLSRRVVRNLLLRKRLGYAMEHNESALADAIWKVIEPQLKGKFDLTQFTFVWDIAPNNPLKPIVEFQWEDCGGGFDQRTGAYDPPGFTNQE